MYAGGEWFHCTAKFYFLGNWIKEMIFRQQKRAATRPIRAKVQTAIKTAGVLRERGRRAGALEARRGSLTLNLPRNLLQVTTEISVTVTTLSHTLSRAARGGIYAFTQSKINSDSVARSLGIRGRNRRSGGKQQCRQRHSGVPSKAGFTPQAVNTQFK